jgi:hypothetical protein
VINQFIWRILQALSLAEPGKQEEGPMTDYTQMTDLQLEVRDAEAREALAAAVAERLAIDRERVRRGQPAMDRERARRTLAKGKPCAECGALYGEPHEDGCTVVELG